MSGGPTAATLFTAVQMHFLGKHISQFRCKKKRLFIYGTGFLVLCGDTFLERLFNYDTVLRVVFLLLVVVVVLVYL